ncbi:MAG TPA: hypothetical protein VNY83_02835 [Solirubrobacterales bacterium]|jgi:hypothetical protein|nr:hypothetical protein [Solirubrobacterales bacterium]
MATQRLLLQALGTMRAADLWPPTLSTLVAHMQPERLGALADGELGPWLDPSLGEGEALDLQSSLRRGEVLYFHLDADRYPAASKLLAAARLASSSPAARAASGTIRLGRPGTATPGPLPAERPACRAPAPTTSATASSRC